MHGCGDKMKPNHRVFHVTLQRDTCPPEKPSVSPLQLVDVLRLQRSPDGRSIDQPFLLEQPWVEAPPQLQQTLFMSSLRDVAWQRREHMPRRQRVPHLTLGVTQQQQQRLIRAAQGDA
ncbi:hypothetical protein DQ04_07851040 [Trypanosoma grayi]|uniref:hypothetical protein n=1 Tax=Trypanosoma grayi TaxID=71804 RepID=UPI0004F4992C|nr:hypothetical protein DQ04_07851040 [Trypanosoma grayi]KEG08166.1 hypothetical protein DQ04_07851040 [Trypanosoma grayi]